LLDDISAAIRRYVVLADHAKDATALWVVHTYLLDAFLITPRLAIRSPTHRCGKTTLLDVISRMVRRPLPTANVTAAALFRVVEACRPTLLIDEADTFLGEAEELRGVVNSGHRWGGAVVRTVGDDHEPRAFSTYGACAIALIGKLPATLHDRSIVIDLKRRLRSESITGFRSDRAGDLDVLARKAARWATDNADRIRGTDPEMPVGIFNRDADNWRPLLAIATVAGGKWPERASEIAKQCCAAADDDDASLLELLLKDVQDVFAEKKVDQIPSGDLVQALVDLEGRPWAEMGKSRKPLTQARLARLLKGPGFRITPEPIRIMRKGQITGQETEVQVRGYVLAKFV
jgi:putative DNA primase/helicase